MSDLHNLKAAQLILPFQNAKDTLADNWCHRSGFTCLNEFSNRDIEVPGHALRLAEPPGGNKNCASNDDYSHQQCEYLPNITKNVMSVTKIRGMASGCHLKCLHF